MANNGVLESSTGNPSAYLLLSPTQARVIANNTWWWSEALHGVAGSPGVNFSDSGEYSVSVEDFLLLVLAADGWSSTLPASRCPSYSPPPSTINWSRILQQLSRLNQERTPMPREVGLTGSRRTSTPTRTHDVSSPPFGRGVAIADNVSRGPWLRDTWRGSSPHPGLCEKALDWS